MKQPSCEKELMINDQLIESQYVLNIRTNRYSNIVLRITNTLLDIIHSSVGKAIVEKAMHQFWVHFYVQREPRLVQFISFIDPFFRFFLNY